MGFFSDAWDSVKETISDITPNEIKDPLHDATQKVVPEELRDVVNWSYGTPEGWATAAALLAAPYMFGGTAGVGSAAAAGGKAGAGGSLTGGSMGSLGNTLSFLPGFGEGFGGNILGDSLGTISSLFGGSGGLGDIASLATSLYGGYQQGEANQLNEDLINLQKRLAETSVPQYENMISTLGPYLQNRLGSTLDTATAQQIGSSYGRAGEQLGNYFASKNMLNSGVADTMYSNLLTEKSNALTNALQTQQNTAANNALSFLGMSSSPATSLSVNTEGTDWTSLGANLADIFNRKSPTALGV